jgi:PAS domain S-box-containing protein
VDCVVSDYDMPGQNGIEFLEAVRDDYPDLPFILYTGKGSEEIASDAISAGVTEYLQKESGTDQYTVLANRIENLAQKWRVEREAARTRTRLSAITENTRDAIVTIDTTGTVQFANAATKDLFGYPPADLVGQPLATLMTDNQQAAFRSGLQEYLDTGSRGGPWTDNEFVVTGHGGDELTVSVSFSEFQWENTRRFVGIIRDISERRDREQAYARLRDLLQNTEAIADVGGWEIDTKTQDVFWTDHLFEMLGGQYDTEPSLDEALDVYIEEDRPNVEAAVEDALENGESFEVEARYERPNGEIRWFNIRGVPSLADGEVETLRGAVQDITHQKAREERLRASRREFKELFNGMHDTAWVIDTDGQFIAVNDAAVETLGYSREELLSMTPYDIDAALSEDEITAIIESLPTEEVQVFETVHETNHGREIAVEVINTKTTYDGETAILSVARDISDRKKRERQLEEFASIVSHDLRSPLNVARGRLELAAEADDEEHLAEAAGALARMETLIDDLLTLARQGETVQDVEEVTLGDHVESCWEYVRTPDGTLVIETTRTVAADPSRLGQLFENLFRNAIDHGGDDITVTVGDLPEGFYVEDDGAGFDDDVVDDLFEAGVSSKPDGTGFGLSIVQQIAEAHGWRVTPRESGSGGARFEFTGLDS